MELYQAKCLALDNVFDYLITELISTIRRRKKTFRETNYIFCSWTKNKGQRKAGFYRFDGDLSARLISSAFVLKLDLVRSHVGHVTTDNNKRYPRLPLIIFLIIIDIVITKNEGKK